MFFFCVLLCAVILQYDRVCDFALKRFHRWTCVDKWNGYETQNHLNITHARARAWDRKHMRTWRQTFGGKGDHHTTIHRVRFSNCRHDDMRINPCVGLPCHPTGRSAIIRPFGDPILSVTWANASIRTLTPNTQQGQRGCGFGLPCLCLNISDPYIRICAWNDVFSSCFFVPDLSQYWEGAIV